ncbi:Lamin-B receptor [Fasciola hepatica]|uniref:Lamin-B receptor n=1 Tax=Fasciola hepatica TaxID=6192 RepID=A0A4E0R301_FASHE|nr:Lamin-B receptor [Fasciola hepatica]
MPSKKAAKPAPKASPRRERSKSVGRSTTKSRSRTPSRSRSRSRAVPTSKSTRTPASESKVSRRRSRSSSSESSIPKPRVALSRILSQAIPDASGDKRSRPAVVRESTPSRFSQRIIEKIETSRPSLVPRERSRSPNAPIQGSRWCCASSVKIADFFRKNVCSSPVLVVLNIMVFIPMVYWLNLLIFIPVTDAHSNKTEHPWWGHVRPFAGAFWPTDWRIYLNIECFGSVLLFWTLHFVLARFVPIGFRVTNSTESRRLDYRCNGLLAFILSLCVFGIAQWSTLPQLKYAKPSLLLPKYLIGLLTASVISAILLSLLAYFASKRTSRVQVNPEGNTGNFFVDFWNGRLTRPRWWGLDWKMFIMRPALIGMLLVDLSYVCAQWNRFGRVSPILLLVTAMHFLWVSDYFVFEHAHLFSYGVRYEGLGFYTIFGLMVMPFLYTTTTSYLSTKLEGPIVWSTAEDIIRCVRFGFSSLMFLVGLWIYRASNNQKALFLRQPNHPTFTDMDKIAGPYTQRLLAGGWWGFVRHPNYLGDLMMAYATGLTAGCQSIFPWLYPLFLTFILLHRIWCTEYHTAKRHGLGMAMYRKVVPSRLIPKLY